MFVVTGLHTKRHSIRIDKPSTTIKKQCVEKARLLPAAQLPHRRPRVKLSSSPSARRASEPRMTRNDSDRNTWNRHEKGRQPPTKPSLGRHAPVRIRKFIPKPLILVERMKARQLLLASPTASEPCIASESLNRSMTAATTPLSTLVTPPAQRNLTCTILSSDSHSFSSVSFQISSRKGVISRSGFGMMCRSTRSFSGVSLDDSSSTADTSVADSPCCMKQGSKAPALLMETNTTKVHVNVKFDPENTSGSDTGVSVLIDSMAGDFMHQTSCSIDTFEPTMTSTPFSSSQGNTAIVPSPMSSIPSIPYPTCRSEQMPGRSHSSKIASPTSQAVFPFNAPKGAYIVKLPNALPAIPHSNKARLASAPGTAPHPQFAKPRAPLATLSNAPNPKPPSGPKRPPSRVSSPPPTLVLDGVFALPHPIPPPSSLSSLPPPRQMLNRPPRPRKLLRSRRSIPLAQLPSIPPMPNIFRSGERSPSPSSRDQPEPESPRSKLARVLNAHVEPQTRQQRKNKWQGNGEVGMPGRELPLVKGSNEARTQCEIESRERIGFGGGGACGSGDGNESRGSDGKGTVECMSFSGVGMVAKLRARWERGEVSCGVPSR